MNCIFCQIVAGKTPASIVFEDDAVVAFMDLFPINEGHVLVIPKQHYAELSDIPAAIAARLFDTVRNIERVIRQTNPAIAGTNVFQNNGKAAGQEVFHAHFHVLPRFPNDGIRFNFNPLRPSRETLNAQAARLRRLLDSQDA